MTLLLLNEDEIRQTITLPESVQVMKSALTATAQGQMNLPGNFNLRLPEVKGQVEVQGTYFSETPYIFLKVSSEFADNPDIGLPRESGVLLALDAATGFPAAIMIDNGYLFSIGSGAAGAIAADYLANPTTKKVAVIGSNPQAFIHLKSLTVVRRVNSVWVWDSSPLSTDNFVRNIVEDHDLDIQIASSIDVALQDADIIIATKQTERSPLHADWIKAGAHITLITTDPTIEQPHLDPEIFRKAAVIIADDLSRCLTFGELHHALAAGAINQADIAGELSDLVNKNTTGRTGPAQITIADLTGLNAQVSALATLAVEKALFLGLGQRLEVGLRQKGMDVGVKNLL